MPFLEAYLYYYLPAGLTWIPTYLGTYLYRHVYLQSTCRSLSNTPVSYLFYHLAHLPFSDIMWPSLVWFRELLQIDVCTCHVVSIDREWTWPLFSLPFDGCAFYLCRIAWF